MVRTTPFDTPQIVEARARAAQTVGKLQPLDKRKLRNSIAADLYGAGARARNRQAYIVIGLPGAGKSTVASRLAEELGALRINCDLAKPRLPGFDGGIGASAVHGESILITNDILLPHALGSGDNIIWEKMGRDLEILQCDIGKLKDYGYDVHLKLVEVSLTVAIERSIRRFERTGNFIDPAFILFDVGNKPVQNYFKLRGDPRLSSTELIVGCNFGAAACPVSDDLSVSKGVG